MYDLTLKATVLVIYDLTVKALRAEEEEEEEIFDFLHKKTLHYIRYMGAYVMKSVEVNSKLR